MNAQRENTVEKQDNNQVDDFKLHVKNRFSMTGSSLLGEIKHETNMFQKDLTLSENFVVVGIEFKRATLREANNFKMYLEQIIQEEEKSIIVNLNKCDFIDSSFFGVLVGAVKRLKAMKKDFYLVYSDDHQLPIFSATGLDKVFTVFNTVEEAIK
ncbi:MAG: STAS domain-containing protein [Ignavibacteriae bacterium]|nr:STAS domain-containing protein [Ignavibacteriota bacterium]